MLPLTNNEKELIGNIEKEIREMNGDFNDALDDADKSTTKDEAEKNLKRADGLARGIRERSQVREKVIRDAIDRLND